MLCIDLFCFSYAYLLSNKSKYLKPYLSVFILFSWWELESVDDVEGYNIYSKLEVIFFRNLKAFFLFSMEIQILLITESLCVWPISSLWKLKVLYFSPNSKMSQWYASMWVHFTGFGHSVKYIILVISLLSLGSFLYYCPLLSTVFFLKLIFGQHVLLL